MTDEYVYAVTIKTVDGREVVEFGRAIDALQYAGNKRREGLRIEPDLSGRWWTRRLKGQ